MSFRDGALAPDLRCAIAHRGISRFRVRCFASPRNDRVWVASSPQRRQTQIHIRLRARGATRPSCTFIFRPLGGRGECRVPVAPAASCALVLVERTRVTTSTPESPDIPARNGFTAYVVLSPVTGLFCHRRLRIKLCLSPVGPTQLRELDTSVGASGPHDFAVRCNISRPR